MTKHSQKVFLVTKGKSFGSVNQQFSTVTPDLIKTGKWRSANFKKYNFAAKGLPISFGALHPLLKVREEFRTALLEMGFAEMETNQYVESSFWNFDSLFQPQQHPARDAHDTFFLREPKYCDLDEEDGYLKKVKDVHQNGGDTGSIG